MGEKLWFFSTSNGWAVIFLWPKILQSIWLQCKKNYVAIFWIKHKKFMQVRVYTSTNEGLWIMAVEVQISTRTLVEKTNSSLEPPKQVPSCSATYHLWCMIIQGSIIYNMNMKYWWSNIITSYFFPWKI